MGKKIQRRGGQRFFVTAAGRRVLAGGVHLQGGNKVLWPFFIDVQVRGKMLRAGPVRYFFSFWKAMRKVANTRGIRLMGRLRSAKDLVRASAILRK